MGMLLKQTICVLWPLSLLHMQVSHWHWSQDSFRSKNDHANQDHFLPGMFSSWRQTLPGQGWG